MKVHYKPFESILKSYLFSIHSIFGLFVLLRSSFFTEKSIPYCEEFVKYLYLNNIFYLRNKNIFFADMMCTSVLLSPRRATEPDHSRTSPSTFLLKRSMACVYLDKIMVFSFLCQSLFSDANVYLMYARLERA
jgi:hypothetical protein